MITRKHSNVKLYTSSLLSKIKQYKYQSPTNTSITDNHYSLVKHGFVLFTVFLFTLGNSLPYRSPGKKVKVKVTPVQTLRLCTGRTAHRGSRRIALPFHDHGTSRGWGVSVTSRPLFTPGKDPVPIVQEAGWAPGPVWTGAENLAPTGIRSLDRPARSQSLYRLRYPAHLWLNI